MTSKFINKMALIPSAINLNFISAFISPDSFSITALAACTLVGGWLLHNRASRQKYFPSPPSDSLLGYMRIMPQTYPWLTFMEWGKKLGEHHGDIIYIPIFGRPVIILNTAEAALDLMEKRGANYSDRPISILLGKMIGWEYITSLIPYGNRFRTQRRIIHQCLNSQAAVFLWPLQIQQVRTFIKNLLISPNDFQSHINRFIYLAKMAMAGVAAIGTPGLAPVDLFPVLQYIPSWFPGARFKRKAKITHAVGKQMVDEPYDKVKEERASGTAQPSLLNTLLEDYENTYTIDYEHELNMKFATGAMFGGETFSPGSHNRSCSYKLQYSRCRSIFNLRSDVLSYDGGEQLPTMKDRPNLPFIECILKEVFRLMMRDERYFPNPDDFKPERFLAKITSSDNVRLHALNTFNIDDPSSLVFGFGRRICPGRFFADANAWLTIANVLAVFDILPPIDPITGRETIPSFEHSSAYLCIMQQTKGIRLPYYST
ncbi:hypothetical protein EW145_g2477 [Phellinidium pouzarii]|uniref:Cytochrome P450 n=1 Tax=Phellinidium pouzarii TaxID=167371 RepID=A0A4S4LG52_9AGAM|nr:hypothetical protein EW145_g2477 [Phellinidium pouzarii]